MSHDAEDASALMDQISRLISWSRSQNSRSFSWYIIRN